MDFLLLGVFKDTPLLVSYKLDKVSQWMPVNHVTTGVTIYVQSAIVDMALYCEIRLQHMQQHRSFEAALLVINSLRKAGYVDVRLDPTRQ